MPCGPNGPIHHLTSSPIWCRCTPTPSVPMAENIEPNHLFFEDFEGPGSINEVFDPCAYIIAKYCLKIINRVKHKQAA